MPVLSEGEGVAFISAYYLFDFWKQTWEKCLFKVFTANYIVSVLEQWSVDSYFAGKNKKPGPHTCLAVTDKQNNHSSGVKTNQMPLNFQRKYNSSM